MEHSKIKFTRDYCRAKNIRYQVKGVNDALFLYNSSLKRYVQVCFSLLNLDEEQIRQIIDEWTE